jgi:hypothetical protein
MECSMHPGTEATVQCVSCRRWICDACREEVAGHAMCQACVQAAQSRYASTPENAAGSIGAPIAAPTTANLVEAEPCGAAQYLKALILGLVAAIIGAFIWDKFVLITGIQLGLIAVLLGILVGFAVVLGAEGKSGALLPWMGALLAGFSILLGYALLAQDVVLQDSTLAEDLKQVPLLIRLPRLLIAIIPALDVLDWLFVAIGVWEGWIIPRRAGQPKQAPS